jgi:Zn-dependent protease
MRSHDSSRRAGFSFRDISLNFWLLLLSFAISAGLLYVFPGKGMALLFTVMGWLVSLSFHEFGHALAAYHGGDHSVIDNGYLTLDPVKYVNPLMSIVLPVVFLLMGGLGLPGAAVYINTAALRDDRWRSFTAAAGPLGTLFSLLILWIPLIIGLPNWFGPTDFWAAWTFLVFILIGSLLLNLLPIPGIDGFGIMEPWLPREFGEQVNVARPFGFFILFALFTYVPAFADFFWSSVSQVADTLRLDLYLASIGYELFRLF